MKFNFKKMMAFCLALILSLSMLAGCGGTASQPAPEAEAPEVEAPAAEGAADEKLTMLVVGKISGHPYQDRCAYGGEVGGEKYGIEVIYKCPAEADAVEQSKIIEDYITRGGIDAVCVAANDAAALTPVLQKARDQGIYVFDYDSPCEEAVVDFSINPVDDASYGAHVWDLLVEHMGDDAADYAILTGGLNASNLNNWIAAGLAHAEEKYPNLNLVTDVIPTEEKQDVAYQKGLELLKAYPNIKGIVTMSSPTPPGAAQAIRELGLEGKIVNVGTGMPTQCSEFLKDGSCTVAALWDPANMTITACYVLRTLADGGEIVDGTEVEGVGTLIVNGKKIVAGDPIDFTADNVDQYPF